jgi:hypothetical protein
LKRDFEYDQTLIATKSELRTLGYVVNDWILNAGTKAAIDRTRGEFASLQAVTARPIDCKDLNRRVHESKSRAEKKMAIDALR